MTYRQVKKSRVNKTINVPEMRNFLKINYNIQLEDFQIQSLFLIYGSNIEEGYYDELDFAIENSDKINRIKKAWKDIKREGYFKDPIYLKQLIKEETTYYDAWEWDCNFKDNLGSALISGVELQIGGQTVDKISNDWDVDLNDGWDPTPEKVDDLLNGW